MSFKAFIKDCCPPVLLKSVRRFRNKNNISFTGNYASWAEALLHASGYDTDAIFQRVREAALKVKRGEAISVSYTHLDVYKRQLLGILLIYPYISMVLDSKYTNKFQYVNDLLPPMHHGDFVLALSLSLAAFYMVKVAIHGQLLKKQNQIVANFTRDMTDNFLHKVLNAKFEIFNALSASRLAGVAFSNTVHASLVLQAVIQIVCELMFLFFLFSIFLASAPKFGIGIRCV